MYFKHPDFAPFIEAVEQKNKITLSGLQGSSQALLAAYSFLRLGNKHLFILPDKEQAAFFYHDLEILLQDADNELSQKNVHFLPATFARLFDWNETDVTNLKLRSEIIDKLLTSAQSLIMVTYPDAIAEKMVSPGYLMENRFEVKKGELVPTDIFLEYLYSFEYKPEDFVFEPGQFAWRGGIFDIFSFSEEYPFRIEFEGDTIQSIRIFDPNTQLSIREVDQIHIMPALSSKMNKEEKVSFFEFLSKETLVWVNDLSTIHSYIDFKIRKLTEQVYTEEQIAEHFINGSTLLRHLIDYQTLEYGSHAIETSCQFDFEIKPQHHFNKNFEYLLDEWVENLEHGYETVFLSENPNQHDRIKSIMIDLLESYNKTHNTHYQADQLFTSEIQTLHEGFRDEKGKLCVYSDHQFFEKYHRFVVRDRYKKSETFSLKELYDLQQGDFVVHVDHGIGIYEGLAKMEINGKLQEVIRLTYKDGDSLYISIHGLHKLTKYTGKDGAPPTLHRLGSGAWERTKEKTKRRVKELVIDLVKLYAERKTKPGFAFSPDSYLQNELEASFMYEDTPDQLKTTNDVKSDMESDRPMDRLVCGDVGFGKTEIAIRAAFKAVCDSKQVAILAPTTVLTFQHFNTFKERMNGLPCNVDYINRFKTSKEVKETLEKLKNGRVDILIGTHRLLSKDVEFKDLGLLIIDEEQKFGVAAKEKIREMKTTIDTMTMSATPIPRTLQFSLMGVRDISVINTPPPNRHPIQTEIHNFNHELIRDAVSFEMSRGGQVFFVNNKIQNIFEISALIKELVPDAKVAVGHGQMDGEALEKVMLDFMNGRYDVLVATTIIESGLDITNANTMIINDAQNFALNVLHQLRGRVGRNNKQAFCYLMVPSKEILTDIAKKRLKAIEDFSDIGSGFQIAMRDLDIRGAGDILGAEQSGFISEMGFEMYQKIINEAMIEIKDSGMGIQMADNEDLIKRECLIETDLGLQLPADYVSSVSERMSLYKELDSIKSDTELDQFRSKLLDIFGPLPAETEDLLQIVPLRRLALENHFDRVTLKKKQFTGYFTGNMDAPFFQSEKFSKILSFMQKHHPQVEMKMVNNKPMLTIKNINNIKSAIVWLMKINAE